MKTKHFVYLLNLLLIPLMIISIGALFDAFRPKVKATYKCPICYDCAAYTKGSIFYTNKIYTTAETMNLVENNIDAEERFMYFLDYNKGNFHYDKVVCQCGTTPTEKYIKDLETAHTQGDDRYYLYLMKKPSYQAYQKRPEQ